MHSVSDNNKTSILHNSLEWLASNFVTRLWKLTGIVFVLAVWKNLDAVENESIFFSIVKSIYTIICTTLSLDGDDPFLVNLSAALIQITIAASIIHVYLRQMGFTVDRFMSKFLNNHIIVYGSNDIAVAAAVVLASSKKVVLIADSSLDDASVSLLRKNGVLIILSKGDDNRNLEVCNINKAHSLLAFNDDYAHNISLCKIALKRAGQNSALRCLCNVPDINLKHNLSTADFFSPEDVVKVSFVNQIELTARKMLDDYPPDAGIATQDNVQIHLVLIGLGSIGQSVLFYLAQLGHYRGGHKPEITVIDPNAEQQYQQLIKRHPALLELLDIKLIENRLDQLSEPEINTLFGDSNQPSCVYICTKNEISNVISAKKIDIARSKAGLSYNIVVVDPPGGSLLQEFNQHNKKIQVVPLFSNKTNNVGEDQDRDVLRLIEYAKDQMAQVIHQDYLDKNPAASINEAWQYLDESIRDSNRYAAAHIDIKIRAIGRKLVPLNPDAPTFIFSELELNILQRLEHARWCAQKRLAGWKYAPIRNNKMLFHPCLVDFDDLPANEKLKDRQSIKNIPHLLKAVNLMIATDTNT
jgi:RyR domain/TrkA-N domain